MRARHGIEMSHPSPHAQTRAFYDRISHGYDFIANASEHAIRNLGIQALQMTKGERVLEIGFGTGHGLIRLADAVGASGRVCGLEISTGMIEVARQHIESAGRHNISVAVADGTALCFAAETFDAVFMSFTLELFDSGIPRVLAEIKRVLRFNGRLGVVAMADSEHRGAMLNLYRWMHRRWPHVVDCQPIDVVGALRVAGFDMQAIHSRSIWGLPVLVAVGVKSATLT
jgi:ubiquinone/menaquinone biosynthesis C-methylase UbiE